VPEYDAFGREIGEDPLAALREATAPVPAKAAKAEPDVTPARGVGRHEATPARPETVVAEPQPPPVAARPRFVRPRSRRLGGFASLIVVVALTGGVGLLAGAGVTRIEGGIEDVLVEPEPAPRGLERASMLREPNVEIALHALRRSGLGRPLTLRVAPGWVDAQLVVRSGRLSLVRFTAQHDLRTLDQRDGARYGATVAYQRIDTATPERLVRGADEPARRIQYVLLDRRGWRAYFRGGTVVRER
jgi:hypothetical protein